MLLLSSPHLLKAAATTNSSPPQDASKRLGIDAHEKCMSVCQEASKKYSNEAKCKTNYEYVCV